MNMLIFLIIFTIVIGFLLIDFSIIGFLPKVIGIWPAINGAKIKKPLIESYPHWVDTNIKGKFIDSMVNNRMGYKTVFLSEDQIVLKNTRLTYLVKINVPSIKYFEIKRNVWGKYIKIYFTENGAELFFSFKPRYFDDWLSCLSKIGIEEVS